MEINQNQNPVTTSLFPVPIRARIDGWTPDRQRAFIEALADCGIIREAAARVGMSEKSVARLRRRDDAAAFRTACDRALRLGASRLRSVAFERAVDELAGVPIDTLHIGLAGAWFALTTGNYYLAALSGKQFLIAAMDGGSSLPTLWTFASADGPVVLVGASTERLGWTVNDDDAWRTYAVACEVLLGSRQGKGGYLTSRVRAPLQSALRDS